MWQAPEIRNKEATEKRDKNLHVRHLNKVRALWKAAPVQLGNYINTLYKKVLPPSSGQNLVPCENRIDNLLQTMQFLTRFSRNTNKMQLCNRICYSKVYWRLNMFRAAHRSSSGALNCVCSLWFIYCNKIKDFAYIIHSPYCNITIVFLI